MITLQNRLVKFIIEIAALLGIFIIMWQIVLRLEAGEIYAFSDPVDSLYFYSGWISFLFLCFGLVMPKAISRSFGLLAFVFGLIHLGVFLVLDFNFGWMLIIKEFIKKYYLYFGLGCVGLMLLVSFGSFSGAFRKYKLYFAVYLSCLLGLLHIVFIQKIITPIYWLVSIVVVGVVAYKFIKACFYLRAH